MNKTGGVELVSRLKGLVLDYDYGAIPVHEYPVFIGINARGHVALLVEAHDNPFARSYRTDLVQLRLSVECSLHLDGGLDFRRRFHILECLSSDENLIVTFVSLGLAIAQQVEGINDTARYLEECFASLTKLFSTHAVKNPLRERQGLWGELFVITRTNNIKKFMDFWHNDPYGKFDFSSGLKRLEVKTTTRQERIHRFSHQQVYPYGNEDIRIASIMLVPDDVGTSLRSLVEEVRNVVSQDYRLLLKLEQALRKAHMSPDDSGPSFNRGHSITNLKWFVAECVPRFNQVEPSGVSDANYKVDLSTTPSLECSEVKIWLSAW